MFVREQTFHTLCDGSRVLVFLEKATIFSYGASLLCILNHYRIPLFYPEI